MKTKLLHHPRRTHTHTHTHTYTRTHTHWGALLWPVGCVLLLACQPVLLCAAAAAMGTVCIMYPPTTPTPTHGVSRLGRISRPIWQPCRPPMTFPGSRLPKKKYTSLSRLFFSSLSRFGERWLVYVTLMVTLLRYVTLMVIQWLFKSHV